MRDKIIRFLLWAAARMMAAKEPDGAAKTSAFEANGGMLYIYSMEVHKPHQPFYKH